MATDKIPTMLRLPADLQYKVKYISEQEHRSMNMQIEYVLSEYVRNYEKDHGVIQTEQC